MLQGNSHIWLWLLFPAGAGGESMEPLV